HRRWLRIVTEPARVVVDDVLQTGAVALHVDQLVDLLLVLDNREASLGVVEDVLHLSLDRVLVERDGDAADRLRSQHGPVELGAVVPDDGHLVAARKAEGGQPEADQASLLVVVPPGVGLPDAEVLLADGDSPRRPLGVGARQLGKGVERGIEGEGVPGQTALGRHLAVLPIVVRPGSISSRRIRSSRSVGSASVWTRLATSGVSSMSA